MLAAEAEVVGAPVLLLQERVYAALKEAKSAFALTARWHRVPSLVLSVAWLPLVLSASHTPPLILAALAHCLSHSAPCLSYKVNESTRAALSTALSTAPLSILVASPITVDCTAASELRARWGCRRAEDCEVVLGKARAHVGDQSAAMLKSARNSFGSSLSDW